MGLVAQAAGVPREIIESAEAKLFELENQNPDKNIIYVKQNDLFKSEVNQKHKENSLSQFKTTKAAFFLIPHV